MTTRDEPTAPANRDPTPKRPLASTHRQVISASRKGHITQAGNRASGAGPTVRKMSWET